MKGEVLALLSQLPFIELRVGASREHLREIRSWQQGLILLEPQEGFGLDTRFAKDALVLIAMEV